MNPTYRLSRARPIKGLPLPSAPSPPHPTLLTLAERQPIYVNLAGVICVCGAEKRRRQSFCRVHYFRLPAGLRAALYQVDGYPETFIRACHFLELPAPAPDL